MAKTKNMQSKKRKRGKQDAKEEIARSKRKLFRDKQEIACEKQNSKQDVANDKQEIACEEKQDSKQDVANGKQTLAREKSAKSYNSHFHAALFGVATFLSVMVVLVFSDLFLDWIERLYCYRTGLTGLIHRFTTMGSPMCTGILETKRYLRIAYEYAWTSGVSGATMFMLRSMR